MLPPTPFVSKRSAIFSQKTSPLKLEDVSVWKLHVHQGAWMRVEKDSLKPKLETVEIFGEWKSKELQSPYFSSSAPASKSLFFPLTGLSSTFSVYSQRGGCLHLSQILMLKPSAPNVVMFGDRAFGKWLSLDELMKVEPS